MDITTNMRFASEKNKCHNYYIYVIRHTYFKNSKNLLQTWNNRLQITLLSKKLIRFIRTTHSNVYDKRNKQTAAISKFVINTSIGYLCFLSNKLA